MPDYRMTVRFGFQRRWRQYIVSTASTSLIGVAASILAYQQFKISKAKLKFELCEKRYALFIKLREFASDLEIGDNKDLSVKTLR
jgi:hypothetical protein